MVASVCFHLKLADLRVCAQTTDLFSVFPLQRVFGQLVSTGARAVFEHQLAQSTFQLIRIFFSLKVKIEIVDLEEVNLNL